MSSPFVRPVPGVDNGGVPADRSRSVDEVRDAKWQARLGVTRDDWFWVRQRQLLIAAQGTVLRSLFPYTSVNTVHFSRCSDYPFTHDCPWIWFSAGGRFVTYAPDPRGVRQGNLVGPPPSVLLDTADPLAAVMAAVAALPETWRQVWVGDIHARPDEWS